LWVRVNDGAQWSNWSTSFTVTASANTAPDTAPAVSVVNGTATHGQSFAAANLFAAHDAENNPLTQFGFWNSGTGGGHFTVDGVALPVAQEIDEPAAYLSHLSYQSGSGADTLYVRAYDGALWGNWSQAFTVTAPPDAAPTVSVEPARDPRAELCGWQPVQRQRPGRRPSRRIPVLERGHRGRTLRARRTGDERQAGH
jgi:hypothetical protein